VRQRRFLPSISMLTAFEAVVRHESVTLAADELDLSQSTVSRLIQSLEGQLGTELFVRQRKRLVPTAASRAYQRDIRQAIELIEKSSLNLVSNPTGGTLSLAVLPTFATRWLAPRLNSFFETAPGVSVNLTTRIKRFEFEAEPFDAVIFHGTTPWQGLESVPLFTESLTACMSPALFDKIQPDTTADLIDVPLLKLASRPEAWGEWFAGQGATVPLSHGMVVDQFSMMIQAAVSGLGIALLPDYLAQIEIAEGRLVPVLDQAMPSAGQYWLGWPAERADYQPLVSFQKWLRTVTH